MAIYRHSEAFQPYASPPERVVFLWTPDPEIRWWMTCMESAVRAVLTEEGCSAIAALWHRLQRTYRRYLHALPQHAPADRPSPVGDFTLRVSCCLPSMADEERAWLQQQHRVIILQTGTVPTETATVLLEGLDHTRLPCRTRPFMVREARRLLVDLLRRHRSQQPHTEELPDPDGELGDHPPTDWTDEDPDCFP